MLGLFGTFKLISDFRRLLKTETVINLQADVDGYVNMKMLVALLKEFHYYGAKEFHQIK